MPDGVDLFPGQGSTGHGKIERFFRTITQLLLQDLPGYVVLATCGIRRPGLACENTSCYLLLLADSLEEVYN